MADINRIRIALVEHKKTSKWLAEQLGKDLLLVNLSTSFFHPGCYSITKYN